MTGQASEPIVTAEHINALMDGAEDGRPLVQICSVSRPEAFSLEAIMLVAQRPERATLRFDYGDMVLAPTREQVNADGVKANVTWSSNATSSVACKEDLDNAVLEALNSHRKKILAADELSGFWRRFWRQIL